MDIIGNAEDNNESYEDAIIRLSKLSVSELEELETSLKLCEAYKLMENLESAMERQTINSIIRWKTNPEAKKSLL